MTLVEKEKKKFLNPVKLNTNYIVLTQLLASRKDRRMGIKYQDFIIH